MKKIWTLKSTIPVNQVTANLFMNPKPPTLYAIMNSIANYDSEEVTKIRNLAAATHSSIFDFEYTLSEAIEKDDFEIDILNHYIMRRINFDTMTAFQLFLENKLHEILPYYNIIFDSLKDYNLFSSGEVITRETTDETSSETGGESSSETRFSEYPLNELTDITDGSYVSNQTTNSSSASSSTSGGRTTNEEITRTPTDKMSIYKQYLETKASVMSMIYKELDILFYGLE